MIHTWQAETVEQVRATHKIVEEVGGMLFGYSGEGQRRPSHVYELIGSNHVRPFGGTELFTRPEGQRPQGAAAPAVDHHEVSSVDAAEASIRRALVALRPYEDSVDGLEAITCLEAAQRAVGRLR